MAQSRSCHDSCPHGRKHQVSSSTRTRRPTAARQAASETASTSQPAQSSCAPRSTSRTPRVPHAPVLGLRRRPRAQADARVYDNVDDCASLAGNKRIHRRSSREEGLQRRAIVAGQPAQVAGDTFDLTVADREVRRHPPLDLPVGRTASRTRGVRLLLRLVDRQDVTTASARSSRSTAATRPSPAGPRITPSSPANANEAHEEVHPHKGPARTGRADVLLGRPVMAAERERVVGRRPDERRDTRFVSRLRYGVDRGRVLLDAVGRLVRRHEEQHMRSSQRACHALAVDVAAGRLDEIGAAQLRRARGVTDDQTLAHAALGEPARHTATQLAGGARDRNELGKHPRVVPSWHSGHRCPRRRPFARSSSRRGGRYGCRA